MCTAWTSNIFYFRTFFLKFMKTGMTHLFEETILLPIVPYDGSVRNTHNYCESCPRKSVAFLFGLKCAIFFARECHGKNGLFVREDFCLFLCMCS